VIGIWRQNGAAIGLLHVSVGIVFLTFIEIRFTECIFRTIVTPQYPINVIEFRVKNKKFICGNNSLIWETVKVFTGFVTNIFTHKNILKYKFLGQIYNLSI